jgi:hypothetical protein
MADLGGSGITDDDRRRAVERLQRHAVPGGALSPDELADRVRRVDLALTRAGIDQVFAGLPPDPAVSPPALPVRLPVRRARRRGSVTGALAGGAVVVLGLGGVLVGLRTTGDEPASEQARPVTTRPEPASSEPASTEPAVTSEPAVTTTVPPPPLVSTTIERPRFSDSGPDVVVLRVGQDIQPGRYLATPFAPFCYWERVSGLGGTIDEVIVNDVLASEHLIVDVAPTDAGLRFQGCEDWQPYTPSPTPDTSLGDGDWLVGSDVAPGSYRTRNDFASGPQPCACERASGFTHEVDEIVERGFPPEGTTTVELHDGERLSSDSCGYWFLQ